MSFSYLSKFNGLANDLNAIKVSNFPVLSLFAKYIVWRVPFELLSNDHGFECKNNLKLLVEPRRSHRQSKGRGFKSHQSLDLIYCLSFATFCISQ